MKLVVPRKKGMGPKRLERRAGDGAGGGKRNVDSFHKLAAEQKKSAGVAIPFHMENEGCDVAVSNMALNHVLPVRGTEGMCTRQ